MSRFVAERDRILESEDLTAMRKMIHDVATRLGVKPPPDDLIEIIFHKTRYEAVLIDPAKRLVSGDWLRERGLQRMTGTPVLPPDKLPE